MKLSEMKIGKKVSVKAQDAAPTDLEEKVTREVKRWGLQATKGFLKAIVLGLDGKGGKAVVTIAKINALLDLLNTEAPPTPLTPVGEIFLQGKDFKLSATDKHFSARQPSMDGEVSIPDSSWGVRAKKAAFDWISKNQDAIKQMTFDQFNSALYKAVGKWPHTYNQMD